MRSWPDLYIPPITANYPQLNLFSTYAAKLVGVNQEFPIDIYVCGITPYDSTHCGHAATYITFDLIHRTSLNVKFLFLGPSIGDCYTYMHYKEERVNAPYRYNKTFKGIITDKGHSYEDSFDLFVRYSNAF